jgi:hypothetical protein
MNKILFIAVALLPFAGYARTLPVIAHWSFDKDAGTTELKDSGPYKLNARLQSKIKGATVQTALGMKGQALKLVNNPIVKFIVPNKKGILDLKVPYSICCWVKRDLKPASMSVFCFKSDSWKYGYDMRLSWHTLDYRWGNTKKALSLRSSHHSIKDKKWMHVAVTNDGKSLKLYINGEQKMEQKGNLSSLQPAYKRNKVAVIGNYLGRANAYNFVGLLDELYIIGKALSEDEIFELADPEK